MASKAFLLTLTFLALSSMSTASAAVRNLCDDMAESGKSSDEQVQKCIAKFGESDTYKENQAKKKWQADAEAAKSAEDKAKQSEKKTQEANVEFKKFTSAELAEAGFGKDFYAIKTPYKNQKRQEPKRITTGDALCKYLGFEKVRSSTLSQDIIPSKANKNGLVIKTNFLGVVSKEPDLFVEDEEDQYVVHKYIDITCAKVISKDVPGMEDLIKGYTEIITYGDLMTTKSVDKSAAVNDSARTGKVKTTPAYQKTDWMNNDSDEDSKPSSAVSK